MTVPPAQVLEMYIPGVAPPAPGVNIFCGQPPSHLMAPVVPPPPPAAVSSGGAPGAAHPHHHHALPVGVAPGLVPHLQHVPSSAAAIYQMNQQFLSGAASAVSSVMTQPPPVLPGSMYVAASIASSSIRLQPHSDVAGVTAAAPGAALDLQAIDPAAAGLISFPAGAQFPLINGVGMPAGIVAPPPPPPSAVLANVAISGADPQPQPQHCPQPQPSSEPAPSSRAPYPTRHGHHASLPVSVSDNADPSPLRQRLSDVLKRKKPSISKRGTLRRLVEYCGLFFCVCQQPLLP